MMPRFALMVVILVFPCHPGASRAPGKGSGVVFMEMDGGKGWNDDSSQNDAFSVVLESAMASKNGKSFLGECFLCKQGVKWVRGWLKDGFTYDEVADALKRKCTFFHIETKDVCHGSIDLFKNVVLDVLSKTKLESDEICDVITGTNCSGHNVPSMEWVVDIPDQVVEHQAPCIMHGKSLPAPSGSLKVLHLTDIHVDFKYQAYTKVKCNQPLCCRGGNPFFPTTSAGHWATLGKCDLPKWTVEDMFRRLSEEKFDYILWTGDLLSHNVWNQTKEEQLEALDFIVDLFVKYFPNTTVYPSLGNHEGVPVNNFPQHSIVTTETADWLYKTLLKVWNRWLPADVQSTVAQGGFYTVLVAPKFRLVSLNMNFCINLNWWLLLNSTDPESELKWLVSILQTAEENGEKVQIIGHIPPGIPDCLKAWSWNYYRIVNRYKGTIAAQFFGHIHYDSFEVFYNVGYKSTFDRDECPTGDPIGVAYVAPSVTTYSNLNPGYRVYEVDGFHDNSTWSVLDHHTYIMDVKATRKQRQPVWIHEYSAKEAYGMESLTPGDWASTVTKLKSTPALFNKYYKYYYKSSPKDPCNSNCRKNMLCALVSGRSHDKTFCDKLYEVKGSDDMEGQSNYSDFVRWYNANKLC